jgi:hypothetical protein
MSIQTPFMEHPTGRFDTACAAMEDALVRLRALPRWEHWITFTAQGQGHRPDSFRCAEVRLLGSTLDVGPQPLDVARIIHAAGAPAVSLVSQGQYYSVAEASPREVAHILDAVFRHHLGIRPFADEGDDYAVGAEW